MELVNFLTMGDAEFFHTILFSVKQISKVYPDSKVYIYNWGMSDQQKRELLEQENVKVVEWEMKFFKIDTKFKNLKQKMKVVYGVYDLKSLIRYILKNKFNIFNCKHYVKFLTLEVKYINKMLCLLDFAKRFRKNFVFLDGDAFVLNRFDELEKYSFDIGVTLRRQEEINLGYGECTVLNVGVFFFRGGYQKNVRFLEAWKEKMFETKECWIEQTSLTRLLYETDRSIFDKYYSECQLKVDSLDIKIKILPCEVYNYSWIEEGVDKDKVKILHFKGGRHTEEKFTKLTKKLDL